ncbi:MAG: HAD-IIA family hydrolase [Solirubrobacterales bacterium]
MALADSYDCFLVDLDGVVWIGREPVPGAPAALRALGEAGKEIVFVTNNPTHPPARYAERLGGMGIEVTPERVVTAGMVVARLAAEAVGPGGEVFVIGAEPLKQMVGEAGAVALEGEVGAEAGAVVVSGHRGFDYDELRTAKRALDAGAALFATSRDPTMPMPGGEWPGTGAVLAAVETASGRRAEIGGKPEGHLFEMALAAIGSAPGDPRVAMVGDRVSSDVAGGRGAGLGTILVLSGTTDRKRAAVADPAPDHIVASLAELVR